MKIMEEQNDDIEKIKKEIKDNKELTKDILDESGKKINKFYQEKLKYHNELKYELETNSKIIKQRDDIFKDIIRHTENDESEKQISIDVLSRDVERLNNLNEKYIDKNNNLDKEYLNKKNKYKKEINKLKDNLNNEQYVRKKLQNLYENLENDNKESSKYVEKYDNLLLEFDDLKMFNEELKEKIYKLKIDAKNDEKNKENMKKYISIISDSEKTIEEYNNLFEEYDQLNEYLVNIEDELEDIKSMLNKTEDDNKKIKCINKLNANKKDYDYINNKIIETKKEIEKKEKEIKDINLLKNEYI